MSFDVSKLVAGQELLKQTEGAKIDLTQTDRSTLNWVGINENELALTEIDTDKDNEITESEISKFARAKSNGSDTLMNKIIDAIKNLFSAIINLANPAGGGGGDEVDPDTPVTPPKGKPLTKKQMKMTGKKVKTVKRKDGCGKVKTKKLSKKSTLKQYINEKGEVTGFRKYTKTKNGRTITFYDKDGNVTDIRKYTTIKKAEGKKYGIDTSKITKAEKRPDGKGGTIEVFRTKDSTYSVYLDADGKETKRSETTKRAKDGSYKITTNYPDGRKTITTVKRVDGEDVKTTQRFDKDGNEIKPVDPEKVDENIKLLNKILDDGEFEKIFDTIDKMDPKMLDAIKAEDSAIAGKLFDAYMASDKCGDQGNFENQIKLASKLFGGELKELESKDKNDINTKISELNKLTGDAKTAAFVDMLSKMEDSAKIKYFQERYEVSAGTGKFKELAQAMLSKLTGAEYVAAVKLLGMAGVGLEGVKPTAPVIDPEPTEENVKENLATLMSIIESGELEKLFSAIDMMDAKMLSLVKAEYAKTSGGKELDDVLFKAYMGKYSDPSNLANQKKLANKLFAPTEALAEPANARKNAINAAIEKAIADSKGDGVGPAMAFYMIALQEAKTSSEMAYFKQRFEVLASPAKFDSIVTAALNPPADATPAMTPEKYAGLLKTFAQAGVLS